MFFDATVSGQTARLEVREVKGRYRVELAGKTLELDLVQTGLHDVSVISDGVSYDLSLEKTAEGFAVFARGDRFDVELKDAAKGAVLEKVTHRGPHKMTAPMPGKIVKVLVKPGETVEAGRGLVVMEAMKMENELKTPRTGTVREIMVEEGQAVEVGALLLIVG